jgi:predicted ATP-dependent serine protease
MKRSCLACGAQGGKGGDCNACGAANTVADEEGDAASERPAPRARLVPLAQAAKRARPPRIELDAPASLVGRLLGGITRGSTVLVHGRGGTGKTTDAIAFAGELARAASGTAVIVAGEMPAWRYEDAARRTGASLDAFAVVEALGGPLPSIEPGDVRGVAAVVYDSANRLDAGHPARVVQAAIALAQKTGHVAIVVAHATAEGDVKGGTDLGHDCDVHVEIAKGAARIVKTREDPLAFEIDRRPPRVRKRRAAPSSRSSSPLRSPRRGARRGA